MARVDVVNVPVGMVRWAAVGVEVESECQKAVDGNLFIASG